MESSDNFSPIKRCIYECDFPENAEVYLTCCFRVICSEQCWERMVSESKAGLHMCQTCSRMTKVSTKLQKVPFKNLFRKRPPPSLESVKLTCEVCVFDLPATSYCQVCPQLLCPKCAERHPFMKASYNHALTTNLDEPRKEHLKKMQENGVPCQMSGHEGQRLLYFCEDCEKSVCDLCVASTCSISEHSVHNLADDMNLTLSKNELARNTVENIKRHVAAWKTKKVTIEQAELPQTMAQLTYKVARVAVALQHKFKVSQVQLHCHMQERLCSINHRIRKAEPLEKFASSILQATEVLKENQDDVSCVNFLRYYREDLNLLSTVNQMFTPDYKEDPIEKEYLNKLAEINKSFDSILSLIKGPAKSENLAQPDLSPDSSSGVPSTSTTTVPKVSDVVENMDKGRSDKVLETSLIDEVQIIDSPMKKKAKPTIDRRLSALPLPLSTLKEMPNVSSKLPVNNTKP